MEMSKGVSLLRTAQSLLSGRTIPLASGPLPSLLELCPLGQKMDTPRGHMFNIGLYRENMKTSSCLKPQVLICSIT